MSAMVKEVYDAFRSAGVSDEQAAAAALSVPPRNELATKTDIGNLRTEFTELKGEFAKLRMEVDGKFTELRAEVKSDIADLRAEVKTNTTELRSEIRELRADTRSDMKDLELRLTLKFSPRLAWRLQG